MEGYLVFDNGDWMREHPSDDVIAWIEDAGRYEQKLMCGHWLVLLVEFTAGIPQRPQALKWEYGLFVEVPNLDPEREPLISYHILVRDFPSLLQFFGLLSSTNISYQTNQPSL